MYAAAKVRPHPRLAPTLVQRVHRRQQGDWGGKRWKALSFIPSLPLCVCVHQHVACQLQFYTYPVMDDWPRRDPSNHLMKGENENRRQAGCPGLT
eukprot:scaffold5221_cov18-Prasinocladus_malaysianus.AAC.2